MEQKRYKTYWDAVDSNEYQSPAVRNYEEDEQLSDPSVGTIVYLNRERTKGFCVTIDQLAGNEYVVNKYHLNRAAIKRMEKENEDPYWQGESPSSAKAKA